MIVMEPDISLLNLEIKEKGLAGVTSSLPACL